MTNPIKNIYFFTGGQKGTELFLLDKETNKWIENFASKFGKDSVSIFNSENRDSGAAKQSIFGGGLFCTKKLTIIKGMPQSAEKGNGYSSEMIDDFVDFFIKNAETIPSDNLVLFCSYNPDKRGRLFNFLKNKCNYREFEKISNFELKAFTQKELGDIKITDKCATFFINKVGEDLYRLSSEIDKLKEYCTTHNISTVDEKTIDLVCVGLTETEVFGFMNKLLHNKIDAINYLSEIENSGTNRIEFAGALYYQLKVNIAINKCVSNGIKDNNIIAKGCGASTGSIFMNMKSLPQISKNGIALENMYKGIIQTEIAIKSGKLTEESFWLNIKKLAMDFSA